MHRNEGLIPKFRASNISLASRKLIYTIQGINIKWLQPTFKCYKRTHVSELQNPSCSNACNRMNKNVTAIKECRVRRHKNLFQLRSQFNFFNGLGDKLGVKYENTTHCCKKFFWQLWDSKILLNRISHYYYEHQPTHQLLHKYGLVAQEGVDKGICRENIMHNL